MKRSSTCVTALAFSSFIQAQSLHNPSFESNGAFDMTGWEWFCTTPNFSAGEGHAGCCGLMLPTSDAFSPCFSTGQAIGVHSKVDGLEAGNPYTLALWEKMSGPDITSDVGLFAVPAGLIPGSFNGVALLQTWPIFSGNGDWMQDMMPFTIPAQYAGMDFYFFIEYSIAPDIIPGTKTFDDIRFIDLTTGLAQHVDQHVDRGHQVVSDLLRVSGAPGPTPVEVLGLDGRSLARKAVHEGTVDVSELPCGTYMARRGNRIQRFTKE